MVYDRDKEQLPICCSFTNNGAKHRLMHNVNSSDLHANLGVFILLNIRLCSQLTEIYQY